MAPRIIVMDDDLPTLALMHDLLAPEGYRVACTNTTEAGLRATRQERPDLIILDLRMGTPEAAWRLLDRLRAEPATANLPVIACSADHQSLRVHHAWLRDRNCSTLAKPFEREELLERVTAAIATARFWALPHRRDTPYVGCAEAAPNAIERLPFRPAPKGQTLDGEEMPIRGTARPAGGRIAPDRRLIVARRSGHRPRLRPLRNDWTGRLRRFSATP